MVQGRTPATDERAVRRGPRMRPLAVVLALALVAAACSGSDDGAAAPETSGPASTDDDRVGAGRASLDEVLGGTQAVQDFSVIVDMRRHDGDESVSFYDEVLDVAASNAEDEAELDADLSFAPVTGFDAHVVDEDGNPLETISVDHGLLSADPSNFELPTELADALEAGGQDAGDRPPATEAFLVEIVSADYARSRTHVRPGDRTHLDLTFVESIAPGDDLEVAHFFGQTYPGDPEDEAGLSPHELFVQRWQEGRIRFLNGPVTPFVHVDRSVEAIEGSTVLTRDQKEALLALPVVVSEIEVCEGFKCERINPFELDDEDGRFAGKTLTVEINEDYEFEISMDPDDGIGVISSPGASEEDLVFMPLTSLPLFLGMLRTALACPALAEAMNEANRAAGGPDDVDCDRERKLPGPPKFPGNGIAFGDLHITTFDGNHYANHAAGEFVLVEQPAMQIRTAPWSDGRLGVSVATAFAADLDGHRVSLHLSGDTWVDGELLEPERGEVVPVGDGELLWVGDGWVLRWPDDTLVRVDQNIGSLVVVVVPAADPGGGLLGDDDGDPANDLATRSGEQLGTDADRDAELFYDVYLDSWRIEPDESLFHYADGESTDTFTIEGFPAEPLTLDALDPDIARRAETQCRLLGLRDGAPLEACIVDVGATGETAFAQDAFVAQTVLEDNATRGEEPADPGAGDGNVLTIGDTTIAFGPSPPIVAPNSRAPSWDCQVDESSFVAVGSFNETADKAWKITIRYFDEDTGTSGEELTVRVDRNSQPYAWVNPAEHFADAIDSVTLDDRTLTASGELYVNDPPVPGLGPVNPPPDGSEFVPFRLEARCAP